MQMANNQVHHITAKQHTPTQLTDNIYLILTLPLGLIVSISAQQLYQFAELDLPCEGE